MNFYLAVKIAHSTFALLSILGFITRGIWMIQESPMLERRWVKKLPHFIDSLLLAAAIILCITISQYPFVDGWLTAKVLALLAYIVIGTYALRRGKTRRGRIIAFAISILVFCYIVLVAVTKQVIPL